MDGVRYGLQQASWENSSALESYEPVLDSDLRGGGAFGDRGYSEGSLLPREGGPLYPRGAFPRDAGYGRAPHGWPGSRRPSLEEEIALQQGANRLEKLNQGRETYKDDPFRKSRRDYSINRAGRDGLLERDSARDITLERVSSRTGSRDRDTTDGDLDWEYHCDRASQQESREGSRDVEVADYPRPRSGTPSRLRRDDSSSFRGDEIARLRGQEFPKLVEENISPRERSGRRSRGEDRDSSRRRRDRDRDYDRSRSRSRDRSNWSPERGRGYDRARSYGHDDRDYPRRSRSPRSRSRGASGRESSYEDLRNERRRDRESTRYHAASALPPSATLVVKGLSQKICEDDLYQALADWGPLRHIRVIKERSTGVSRGFAFVDFPDVEAAQKMMEGVGYDGIVVDGRRIFFEYSSKPTGGPGSLLGGPGRGSSTKSGLAAADWMCTVCGCNNFARRVVCFQCNEARTDESPAADLTAASGPGARRASEAGPTHVLVVRGLDESVNEESLHCEFSKFAVIKDLRLVRDKFTSVSRGFAFIHFHSVEDAAKALESTNGIALDKNGQLLRVAFAKSIGPSSANTSQGSAAAAAAIEAATFAQQYDMVGWAPKEYNPADNAETGMHKGNEMEAGAAGEGGNGAPQSGFVWDEASGYYYDAASGFYYDGNRGLYYDGNSGVWYTYDQETQQYTTYVEPEGVAIDGARGTGDVSTTSNTTSHAKAVVISAPPVVTIDYTAEPKKPTLAEAVAAAAEAAKLSAKKEKERMKEREREIRLAGKGVVVGAGKKKMNNVMSVWKQRQHEGSVPATLADESHPSNSDTVMDGNTNSVATGRGATIQASPRLSQAVSTPNKTGFGRGMSTLGRGGGNPFSGNYHPSEGAGRARPVTQSSGRGFSVFGNSNPPVQSGASVGRGAGRGRGAETGGAPLGGGALESAVVVTPFKTDASALGAFPNSTTSTARRRFTETPQSGYRDRAAERRSLYASTVPADMSETDGKEKGKDMPFPPGVGARGSGAGRGSDMPFPPGVGGAGSKQGMTDPSGAVMAGPESQSFEVITAEKALDASNVGNRMLRNMGWQEGSGLGKEGTGIVEPVLAHGAGERAGLGSQSQPKKTDARFETLPGDSYRIVIQKKALARFHEMI